MRGYVEKKPEFEVEGKNLLKDVKESLGLDNLQQIRVVQRYDVEGLTSEEFDLACQQVFCEKSVDKLHLEDLPIAPDEIALAVEYLPGQYDQRADSAAQCIQLLTLKEQPIVKTAWVYVLKGNISPEEIEAFKKYCINPIDSREAAMAKPQTVAYEAPIPEEVPIFSGFISFSSDELKQFHLDKGLSMSEEDLAFCQEYFQKENRDPSVTEIKVIDTYWSDHCRHTTFNTIIERCDIEEGPYREVLEKALLNYFDLRHKAKGEAKPLSLMDMATVNARAMYKTGELEDLDVSEEINAASIKVWAETDQGREPWLVMFKNETHNHPTEIEPFGGAATCIGGAIRDPLSGRVYVYQAMRVTGAANPLEPIEETLAGKLPQRTITRQAALGYSSYGNQIGVATGFVDEVYHPGYKAKRMEVGAVVGAAPAANVIRKTPTPGDLVLLLGGRTGRDGCGGATGSSKAHDEASLETSGAEVQKGNAPIERKLQRLYRKPEFARLIKRCNDFGAGGVSVAIGELAPSLDIDLDKVPKKYEGLDGTELAISESQERMAIVIAPESLDQVLELAAGENLEATVVAKIADHGRMKMTWQGKEIVNLTRSFLDSAGVQQKIQVKLTQPQGDCYIPAEGRRLAQGDNDIVKAWHKALAELNICSKKGLIEHFDSSVGRSTVLFPLGGKNQETPAPAMVAKLPVLSGETTTGTWMSYGFDPGLSQWSPYHGGMFAVVDALTKLAVSGGQPLKARLSFQEYFPRLEQDPAKWGRPMAALLGAQVAMANLSVPAIGGKDSMSGTFEDIEVPSTLCAFALAVGEVAKALSPEFKKSGSQLVFLPMSVDETCLPNFQRLKDNFSFINDNHQAILGAAALGQGGLLATLAKGAFGNDLGARVKLNFTAEELFRPSYGAMLVEMAEDFSPEKIVEQGGVIIGQVIEKPLIDLSYNSGNEDASITVSISALRESYSQTLEPVFPTKIEETPPQGLVLDESGSQKPGPGVVLVDHTVFLPKADLPLYKERNLNRPAIKKAKPKVVMPLFPGTNCEYDSIAAFEAAGAVVETIVLRNLTPQDVADSLKLLADAIKKTQIIMIPGGFSGGDEPGGSGKLIAATFRSPWVAEATEDLLKVRDGLILGICNGFQGLIKVGLVPYGEIRPMRDDSPTLIINSIGRHQNAIVRTRITSVKSPWLAEVEPGEIHHLPLSHGEGRLKASPEELALLFAGGQVATQYVDEEGKPSLAIEDNPNGSLLAIEGLTSPDGRVFGKMAHSERIATNLYKNVPGNYDQRIFASGVKYFS